MLNEFVRVAESHMRTTLTLTATLAVCLMALWIAPRALALTIPLVLVLPFILAFELGGSEKFYVGFLPLIFAYLLGLRFSTDMDRSVVMVSWVMAAMFAFFAWRALTARMEREHILTALMAVSALPLLANALAYLQAGTPASWQLAYDTNNAHALFNMLFIVALATGQLRWRWAWVWLVGYVFIAIYSNARASWLGLAAGTATLVLLDGKDARALMKRYPWAVAVLCIAGLAVIYWQTFMVEQGRRQELWSTGWRLFAASPWFGSGPDTYQAAFAQDYPAIAAISPYNHPHNQVLMWLDDAGLIGAAAGLWLTAVLARALWQRRADPWARGALAAFASLAAVSLFDTPTTSAYVTATFLALAAAGLHLPCSSTTTSTAAFLPG